MLLEKSKFSQGDTVSLKLITGEEIIGKYVKEDMSTITLSKPLMLAMSKQGPAMMPLMMTVNPEQDFAINKQAIILQGETVKEIADQYTFQTTGIQPVSAGSIVTG
jgi:hypothetical protein